MTKTFYQQKVLSNGQIEYEPVKELDDELLDALPYGSHLITVEPNSQSRVFNVNPNFIDLLAASIRLRDQLSTVIRKQSEYQLNYRQPLTTKQQAAWQNLQQELGNSMFTLSTISSSEIAQNVINELIEMAKIPITNPAVKRAWDNFITTVNLCKEYE